MTDRRNAGTARPLRPQPNRGFPMAGANPERVRALLTPALAALGLDLDGIALTTAGRRRLLRIFVDADGGVSLDQIAQASHTVSDTLDASDLMGEQPYVLEVSSPGVDRPLTEARHWRRAIGRLVKVNLADGSEIVGRVLLVDESGALLDVLGHDRRVSFAEVTRARIEVEFGRAGDALDDADAADDAEDESAGADQVEDGDA